MQRKQVTLQEKLSEHYQKRNFQPKKQAASYMTMIFFSGMVVTLFIENLVFLLPNFYIDEDGSTRGSYHVAQIFVIFVFIQCVINWWQSYYDVPNRVTKELKSEHYPNLIETPPGLF